MAGVSPTAEPMRLIEDLVLYGPNRRSDRTLIEVWLQADPGDAAAVSSARARLGERLVRLLADTGVAIEPGSLREAAEGGEPLEGFSRIVCELVLALQRAAGHRVGFRDQGPALAPDRFWFAVEHEHTETGVDACALALEAAVSCIEGLDFELARERDDGNLPLSDRIAAFVQGARPHVLPRETQAIIDAAARLDIPCVKLDREPYEGVSGPFRLRPNGLLKLGQGCRQRVVDGSFAIDSPERAAALLFDRAAVCRALGVLGLPRPAHDPEAPVVGSVREALRTAEALGYPVTIRSRQAWRSPPPPEPVPLDNAGELLTAAEEALAGGSGAVVEGWVPGAPCVILVAGGEVVCALLRQEGGAVADVSGELNRGTRERALEAARQLGVGLLTLTVVSRDVSRPLEEGGVAVDLDVAPALDALLPEAGAFAPGRLMAQAAEGLVRYLFPAGVPARIPLAVVTGTNGKTTTSTLIARMLKQAGYFTGRASTTGVYLDEARTERGDLAGGSGHHRVLETPEVQAAVLETARGGVTSEGLMFDACDVAVCTNVSADHLGLRGVETVEDMAELKEMIVQRARDAIVLNADNAYSLGMLPRVAPRQAWLVSALESAEELRDRHGETVNFCTLEPADGRDWIAVDAGGSRQALLPVDEVPMTFGGRLRFNVSNALQAVAAAVALGLPEAAIRQALAEFRTDFESSPGRLNFYEELPFTVLFDYVHNPDGHQQMAEFVRSLDVPGRRILHFAASASWSDDAIREQGRTVAGQYDLYLCRDYPMRFNRQPGEVGALLREGLLEKGVDPESAVQLRGETTETLAEGLAICRPGDLLVFACSTAQMQEEWDAIRSWSA